MLRAAWLACGDTLQLIALAAVPACDDTPELTILRGNDRNVATARAH
jgi:hypothetical protein